MTVRELQGQSVTTEQEMRKSEYLRAKRVAHRLISKEKRLSVYVDGADYASGTYPDHY